jgi:hypothetical protein
MHFRKYSQKKFGGKISKNRNDTFLNQNKFWQKYQRIKEDLLWRACNRVEKVFGYNSEVEKICANVTYLLCRNRFNDLRKSSDRLVVVTLWMPSYLDHICEVLNELEAKGARVALFPEWRRLEHPEFEVQIRKISDSQIFYDLHRALPKLTAKVFLSSTATKHFYFSRNSKNFFYFHSVAGLSGFPEEGLDYYSYFLCATEQQYSELLDRFTSDKKSRKVFCAGYPKLDKIIKKIDSNDTIKIKNASVKRILIAPTYADEKIYTDLTILPLIDELISGLIRQGRNVVFRPHPVSLRRGPYIELISSIKRRYASEPLFVFDESQDYFRTYVDSDLMVTDVSGTSLIFRVAFKKPVIFLSKNLEASRKALNVIPNLGHSVRSIDELKEVIDSEGLIFDQGIKIKLFNQGRAMKVFVEILERELWMN